MGDFWEQDAWWDKDTLPSPRKRAWSKRESKILRPLAQPRAFDWSQSKRGGKWMHQLKNGNQMKDPVTQFHAGAVKTAKERIRKQLADAPGRSTADILRPILNPTHHTFREMQSADEEIKEMRRWIEGDADQQLTSSEAEGLRRMAKTHKLKMIDGILGSETTGMFRPWIPKEKRAAVVCGLCNSRTSCASGNIASG